MQDILARSPSSAAYKTENVQCAQHESTMYTLQLLKSNTVAPSFRGFGEKCVGSNSSNDAVTNSEVVESPDVMIAIREF